MSFKAGKISSFLRHAIRSRDGRDRKLLERLEEREVGDWNKRGAKERAAAASLVDCRVIPQPTWKQPGTECW